MSVSLGRNCLRKAKIKMIPINRVNANISK